jgi:hypothetical protein
MHIKNVRYTDGGFILNNQFFIPNDEDNLDYQNIQLWVKKGNVVEDGVRKSIDQLIEEKQSVINLETSRRILEPYPDYKQRNIDREALLFPDHEDKKHLQVEMHNYITSIITKGKELKAFVTTLDYDALAALDITSDSYWS